ncbi:hypothetical protein AArc1_1537 [Natrarchaeobaculum sulfurireducens]|uniref:Uncharacterized protein n=1 Tax=Natrarchaeobaculum sulfurireducens TaxID=2044521 RepID=A0A346PEC5_9EURY|nr:hypothetical protein AArc1_1537 [Natrarchaeobaculum sulfurireducens]
MAGFPSGDPDDQSGAFDRYRAGCRRRFPDRSDSRSLRAGSRLITKWYLLEGLTAMFHEVIVRAASLQ